MAQSNTRRTNQSQSGRTEQGGSRGRSSSRVSKGSDMGRSNESSRGRSSMDEDTEDESVS